MPRPIDSIARELALQYLYSRDAWKGEDAGFDAFTSDFPTAKRAGGRAALIAGLVTSNQPAIDALISATADDWPIHRISFVCRNVLRIGVAELLFRPNVPFKVVIDESIELTRRYDSDSTVAFVNGILDRIAQDHRSAEIDCPDAVSGSGG